MVVCLVSELRCEDLINVFTADLDKINILMEEKRSLDIPMGHSPDQFAVYASVTSARIKKDRWIVGMSTVKVDIAPGKWQSSNFLWRTDCEHRFRTVTVHKVACPESAPRDFSLERIVFGFSLAAEIQEMSRLHRVP